MIGHDASSEGRAALSEGRDALSEGPDALSEGRGESMREALSIALGAE